MIELFEFQIRAADSIVDRYAEYWNDPAITGRRNSQRAIPFFQSLASITASGKTVILAEAVAGIAAGLAVKPVVLWISRGKVVVEQSFSNLSEGGRYHHLLGGAQIKPLSEYNKTEVLDVDETLVYFATVGTFNQKDKEQGSRLIYKCDIDTTDQSTWDALKERLDRSDRRRPMLVVYDEAHNLSDQQTDLLMELDPQALLLASATMQLPARLAAEIAELKAKTGHDDSWLVTRVDASAVAEASLVKSTVLLAGYRSPMEETLDAMLADLHASEADAELYGLGGKPKAIYVSQTNIVEGNDYQSDNHRQPFVQRQAPPILIWRYLVEKHGIDPDLIAVYCSLKFDKMYPPPDDFRLFNGGDNDYQKFADEPFQHIIFNLSLQEGWDDPMAYFAYIDKSMQSRIQVEQIIGRLLRQPNVNHYPAERLNTAHFYVRVDREGVFDELISEVGKRLTSEAPTIKLVTKAPGKNLPIELPPKRRVAVPGTGHETSDAIDPISLLIAQFTDYRGDEKNTRGEGTRRMVRQRVGEDADLQQAWESYKRSTVVSARWLFTREVRRLFQNALGIAPTNDPKFDAMIGVGSAAHSHVQTLAIQVVDAYLNNVYLKQRGPDPYIVGPILVRDEDAQAFSHALHAKYDGLNGFEKRFAEGLDATKKLWARNPSRTGYGIPLISPGTTRSFYPDFLVWDEANIIAVDTTGGHLLPEKLRGNCLPLEHQRIPNAEFRSDSSVTEPGRLHFSRQGRTDIRFGN